MSRWLAVAVAVLIPTFATAQPIRVYLGEPPRTDGFTSPRSEDLEAGYKDMVKQYPKLEPAARATIVLVPTAAEADLILTLTVREMRPSGTRSGGSWVVGSAVVGTSHDIPDETMLARLSVPGRDVAVDLDGWNGISWRSWSNLAKSLLKQTADWAAQNRAALGK